MNSLDFWRASIESTGVLLREQMKLGERPPARLYHYTSAEGLLGILSQRELWASEVSSVNDLTEFRYGVNLMSIYCEERLKGATGGQMQLLTKALEFMEWVRDGGEVFLACFCAAHDQLSQWNEYGSLCIEFEVMPRTTASEWFAPEFCPAVYDVSKVASAIEQTIEVIIRRAEDAAASDADITGGALVLA